LHEANDGREFVADRFGSIPIEGDQRYWRHHQKVHNAQYNSWAHRTCLALFGLKAPSATKRFAVAKPSPLLPPVIKATLSCKDAVIANS
jgi:hypothetical protein